MSHLPGFADRPRIVIIGAGAVGRAFTSALTHDGIDCHLLAGRGTSSLSELARVDIVLSVVTGEASLEVARKMLPYLPRTCIFADLTSASPGDIKTAAHEYGTAGRTYVDGAIMGAVGVHGLRTPIIAAGADAVALAAALNPLGFEVTAKPEFKAGDASALKLLRSIFAKGLDMLVIEAMVAARAFGMEEALLEQLSDFDRTTMRKTVEMYLKTHLAHAARRHHEMREAERQLLDAGLPTIAAAAAIRRYQRTMDLLAECPPAPADDDAVANLKWLVMAERNG